MSQKRTTHIKHVRENKLISRTANLIAINLASFIAKLMLLLAAIATVPASAQEGPEILPAVRQDVSPPLREIPPQADASPRHIQHDPHFRSAPISTSPDGALQTTATPQV